MDSKLVTRGTIPIVARAIEEVAVMHALTLVAPPRFNELFAQFKTEGRSLNDLLAWAHARALADAIARFEAATGERTARVIVDEFARVKTEVRTSRAFDVTRYPVEQRVRAEDEVAVGAASILAKAAYERWIDSYEKKAGIPVRSLPREKVREHPKAQEFAKVSYLKPS
jgi:ribonuclease HIII